MLHRPSPETEGREGDAARLVPAHLLESVGPDRLNPDDARDVLDIPALRLLVGVGRGDTETEAEYLARRIQELRVFEDGEGRMNRSVLDVDGAVLAVPQFTLLAGLRKGRRPDFLAAAINEAVRRGRPSQANVDFDGADRSARIIGELLRRRP